MQRAGTVEHKEFEMEWPPARFMLVETIPSSSLLLYKEWKIRLEDWKKREKRASIFCLSRTLSLSLAVVPFSFQYLQRIEQFKCLPSKLKWTSSLRKKKLQKVSSDQTCSISKNEGKKLLTRAKNFLGLIETCVLSENQ